MAADFIVNGDRVEIPLSKVKLSFLLLIAIVFVVGGVFFILHPSDFQDTGYHNRPKWEILAIGYACVIFFWCRCRYTWLTVFQ